MAIALLTDFGTRDHFAASMKGVITGIAPEAAVFDITHEIPPGDIHAAAFTLFACFRDVPAGTVIVGVVDPGVGSERRPVAVAADDRFLIGPDNGIFSFILDSQENFQVHLIEREFRPAAEISTTFHGRDIFAPAAAHIALGRPIEELGRPLSDPVRLPCIYPETEGETIIGRVLHIDRFGNIITNLPAEWLDSGMTAELNGRQIKNVRRFYSGAEGGELFMIAGSIGLVEISLNGASAAADLGVSVGDAVVFRKRPAGITCNTQRARIK
ncbi:MAG: SAM-dependent chlorinase/fluorinase [Acidobacteria bacterium]|nr:SAM-dependent chlorinase/fluorinase [Acidobacteriota bacterium]